MSKLLNSVIEAHGGFERWSQFSDLVTDIELREQTGLERSLRGIAPKWRLLLSLRGQGTIINLSSETRLMLQPGFISLHKGTHSESLAHPNEILPNRSPRDWDILQLGYFMGTSVRQLVTAPFAYALPGVKVKEIDSWKRHGESWRGLQITYFPDLAMPVTQQDAYYGEDGLLRSVHNQGAALRGLNLVEEIIAYEEVEKIRIPKLIEVYAQKESDRRTLSRKRLGQIHLSNTFLPNLKLKP